MILNDKQAAEVLSIVGEKFPLQFENALLTWKNRVLESVLANQQAPQPEAVTSDGHVAGQVVPLKPEEDGKEPETAA